LGVFFQRIVQSQREESLMFDRLSI
jgi:hypothetical protein